MATIAQQASWTDQNAVSGHYARKVLAYIDCIKRTVEQAKEPGFDESGWNELATHVDPATFQRVGNHMEVMDWQTYVGLLMQWGTTTDFWSEFRRISEAGNRVFLELTEHNQPRGAEETVVNSCTVYQFNDAGKLTNLGIFLQHQ